MGKLWIMSMAVMVAACAPEPPQAGNPVMPPAVDGGQCGAEGLQGLVGKSATILQTMRFGTVTRIIRPGMAVTMDYSAERLNIMIDEAEMISAVHCG